jgi:hypothetical protein
MNKKALIENAMMETIRENVKVADSQALPKAKVVSQKPKPAIQVKSKPVVAASSGTGSGRQAAFWLDDEDRGIFREVGILLYTQGIKPSDNLVLRAALRLMPRDHRLTEQIQSLVEKDGRRLRHRDKDSFAGGLRKAR